MGASRPGLSALNVEGASLCSRLFRSVFPVQSGLIAVANKQSHSLIPGPTHFRYSWPVLHFQGLDELSQRRRGFPRSARGLNYHLSSHIILMHFASSGGTSFIQQPLGPIVHLAPLSSGFGSHMKPLLLFQCFYCSRLSFQGQFKEAQNPGLSSKCPPPPPHLVVTTPLPSAP